MSDEPVGRLYHPVEIFRPLTSAMLLLAAMVWGVIAGLLAFGISLFLPLLLLLPIGMGALGGHYLQFGINRWKLTHRPTVIVCAVMLGLAAWFAFHQAGYVRFASEARQMIAAEMGTDDFTTTHELFQERLRRKTGATGFWGYTQLVLEDGLTIGRFGRESRLTLRGPLLSLYWGVEIALIVGVALALALERAKRPLCPTCETWYLPEQVGRVPQDEAAQFLERLRAGEYHAAGELISLRDLLRPYLSLYLDHCTCARGDSILTVSEARENAQGQVRYQILLQALLTVDEENDLLDATTEWEEETKQGRPIKGQPPA